jgi:hypothetical protein
MQVFLFKYAGNKGFRKHGWLFHQYTTTSADMPALVCANGARRQRSALVARVFTTMTNFFLEVSDFL